jgi:hypothetical protein
VLRTHSLNVHVALWERYMNLKCLKCLQHDMQGVARLLGGSRLCGDAGIRADRTAAGRRARAAEVRMLRAVLYSTSMHYAHLHVYSCGCTPLATDVVDNWRVMQVCQVPGGEPPVHLY